MTTNFVYIIYIRARRNQHQWVYSLWPGWCSQPAPSSVTLLCSLHHHQLHYSAACTIISYTTLQPAPSSFTLLCSLHHHQLHYSTVCSRTPTQSQNPVCCTGCRLLAQTFQAHRNTAGWGQKGQVSNIRSTGRCHSGYACASENVTLWLVTTMASFSAVDRTGSQQTLATIVSSTLCVVHTTQWCTWLYCCWQD